MTLFLLDFESRSRADLKVVGGRLYWQDPTTEVLCCAWYNTGSGDVGVWRPGDPCPFPSDAQLGAHNWSGFDRFGAIRLGWIDEHHIGIDTSELARKAGLPGALEALGERYGVPKDKAASKFTKALSSVKRPKAISAATWKTFTPAQKRARGDLPPITADVMARVVPYCVLDVQILAMAWPELQEWQDVDAEVNAIDRVINDRGVYFDRDLAKALLFWDTENTATVLHDVAEEMGEEWTPERVREVASSPKQFCDATGLDDARKSTVRGIDHPLVRARAAIASIARGKLLAGLARTSDDGRMRDTMRYYGAHTGRWSGKGMQLQNLPRPAGKYEEWSGEQIDALARAVVAGEHAPTQDEIVLLVRACIAAQPGSTLAVCDFSGVEARALAWAAGDAKALETFASGRDPYKVAAATIFGVSYENVTKPMRQVGKIAELACGYGQGGKKFAETATLMGADLEAVGVNSFAVVKAWRKLHAPITRFWCECEDAFVAAIGGQTTRVSCFTFTPSDDGRDVAVILPSGRPVVYNHARLGGDGSLAFEGTHGPEHTYGGKIVENIIQALCRDLMAECLMQAEVAELPVVMHVHDEIVIEVPKTTGPAAFALLKQIMSTPPEWASGFPLGAAGFVGERYRK